MASGLLYPLESSIEMQGIVQCVRKGNQQLVYGLTGAQVGYLTAGIHAEIGGSVLMVTSNLASARKIVGDLQTLLPGREIYLFPEAETMPFEVLAQSKEITSQRITVLAALSQNREAVVVAPIEALVRQLVPPALFAGESILLEHGAKVDLEELVRRLATLGFERVAQVEGPGQFAVRGGIIDIFPLNMENPVRLELFDDETDSIRCFDIASQRSLEKLEVIRIYPARELVVTEPAWAQAYARVKADLAQQVKKLGKLGLEQAVEQLENRAEHCLERLEEHIFFEGLEQFAPYFYKEQATLFDYLPEGCPVCVEEPGKVKATCTNLETELAESWTGWLEKGLVLPGQSGLFAEYALLFDRMSRHPLVGFALLPKLPVGWKPVNIVNILAKTNPALKGQINLLAEDLRRWRKKDYGIVILADTEERCQKLLQLIRDARLDALYLSNLSREIRPGNIIITEGTLQNGFELTNMRLVVLTEVEILGTAKKGRPKTPRHAGSRLEAFAELNVGDNVVHVTHGIGVYQGVHKLEAAGIQKDYLLIKYAGEDKLYVPTDQVSQIQKYLGGEGHRPKLSKLGGNEWAKVKSRVKESVKEMAEDLLKLYASRQALQGFRFSPDSVWQSEFEDAFPFEETPDQLQAVKEIKEDMESTRPMDRLLCGDVGYGKTEVSIRAAFKAVNDGKQVAVLVPTTILAQQHYNTFRERFANYPVTIEMISRFRSPKDQAQTLKRLSQGKVDIVIGTHRLVQEDIGFRDLGLVIIDEEQRFGVAHKEKLKVLRSTVDVLTLSATPIPRTLHMSLIGARDMSLLETPPEDRYPVQTYVVEFNYQTVGDAVMREINRGGQVYFVHNRVMDIERVAEGLAAVVPDVRIGVAHGQMREDQLERVMVDFLEGEYDVLVCTTIIESGLDIPNVNTIIVDEADHLGLSQLYQLRGRVGRSNRRAYAYLTYRRDKVLSEIAEKRLQAIREFTEFGSGFKIAMRDMEIRGAGNVLGPEQHGHIMAVGFDMYCRLLEESVQQLQGEKPVEQVEPTVEIPLDAFIADDYIPDQPRKMEMYRKIMLSRLPDAVDEVYDELVDRFGDPPPEVLSLLDVARLKILCLQLGVSSVSLQGQHLIFGFTDKPSVGGEELVKLATFYPTLTFSASPNFQMKLKLRGAEPAKALSTALEAMERARGIMEKP